MASESLKSLQFKFPHWGPDIGKLHRFFGMRPTSIYIPGPQDLEKSSMLRELLSLHSIRVAYVRGSETYWSRNLFFEKVLMQLKLSDSAAKALDPIPNYASPIVELPDQRVGFINIESCGNMALFIEKLKAHFLRLQSGQVATKTPYILIEDVDKLDAKVFGENFLAVILRLEELTSIPFGIIMTGSCDWNDLQPEFSVQAPLVVHLRAPNADEMISMLRQSRIALPSKIEDRVSALKKLPIVATMDIDEEGITETKSPAQFDLSALYHNLVPLVVNSLRLAYPTKNELLYIILQLLPRYIEPALCALESGSEPPSSAALYASISPYFAVVMNCSALMMLGEALDEHDNARSKSGQSSTSASDFPLICKYLILGAWIAARNPTIDIEIKNRKRRRKTNASLAARLEEDMFDPPSSWRLDKLLSILDHLLAGNEEAEELDDDENIEDQALLKRLQTQILEDLPEEKAEEVLVPEPQPDSSQQLWKKVEFNETVVSFDEALPTSQLSSQPYSDGISWGYTSEEASQKEPVPDKAFDTAAMFPLLWESHANHTHQLEILTQIGVLEQIGLFIRSGALTSTTARSRAEYRCGFDASFAHLVADSINFPLWGFL